MQYTIRIVRYAGPHGWINDFQAVRSDSVDSECRGREFRATRAVLDLRVLLPLCPRHPARFCFASFKTTAILFHDRHARVVAEARAVSEYGVQYLEMLLTVSRRRGYGGTGENTAKPRISEIFKLSSWTISPPSES